jgi:hypothetical protein
MRTRLIGAVVVALVAAGCGSASPAQQLHRQSARRQSLRRALLAAYDRPFFALVRGDAVKFCAAFTAEVQRALAHRRGATTCTAALTPPLNHVAGQFSQRGLDQVALALHTGIEDPIQAGTQARFTERNGATLHVTHFRLANGRWLIADIPVLTVKHERSHTRDGVSGSADTFWATY